MTTRERIGMALLGSIGIFLLAAGAIFVPANCPLPQPAKTIIVTATPMPTREAIEPDKITHPVKVPQEFIDTQLHSCLGVVKPDRWHALLNSRGETVWWIPPRTQVAVDLIGPLYMGGEIVLHLVVFEQSSNGQVVRVGGWAFSDGLELDPACLK